MNPHKRLQKICIIEESIGHIVQRPQSVWKLHVIPPPPGGASIYDNGTKFVKI